MTQIIAWLSTAGIDIGWIVLSAIAVAIAGVGRLARIITYDAFPPSVWWRKTWAELTNDGPWEKLFSCYWCLTPWIMLVAIAWAVVAFDVFWLAVAWWAFWGWLGISYLSSILVNHDERD